MKSILLRSLCILAIALLIVQDSQAQRGRHGRGYGYGYAPYRGQRVLSIAGPRLVLPYRGISLHFSNGYYYRPYGGYFRVVAPPIGIHINILPRGYRSIYAGGNPYYYYGGAYYRPGPNRDYEVVDAPLGASVPELPAGAQVVVINEQKYFELDGTYYKEDIRSNNEIWYTVVGKDGKLNTDEAYDDADQGPVVGDIIDKLPDNCRTVTVSDRKYFVSEDNVYYEEFNDNNTIRYKVVGK